MAKVKGSISRKEARKAHKLAAKEKKQKRHAQRAVQVACSKLCVTVRCTPPSVRLPSITLDLLEERGSGAAESHIAGDILLNIFLLMISFGIADCFKPKSREVRKTQRGCYTSSRPGLRHADNEPLLHREDESLTWSLCENFLTFMSLC